MEVQGKHTEYILRNAEELGEDAVQTLTSALNKHLTLKQEIAAPVDVDYVESMTEAISVLQSRQSS